MKLFLKKKWIVFFLLIASTMAFARWNGGSTQPSSHEIDGKNFYEISSPEELAWFSEQVNNGSSEINAILTNDIVMFEDEVSLNCGATPWHAIGDTLTNVFNGIFDGNGKTISGLYVNDTAAQALDSIFAGLFGIIGQNGVIKNLSIENAFVFAMVYRNSTDKSTIVEAEAFVGGFAGYNMGQIENVNFSGKVYSHAQGYYRGNSTLIGAYGYVGGIAGQNQGSIKKAKNTGGTITGISESGESVYTLGGIAGRLLQSATIEDCSNGATVKMTSHGIYSSELGGIAGENSKVLGEGVATIINCENHGIIEAAADSSGLNIGGIIAVVSDNAKISGNVNTGAISVYGNSATIAGIVGYAAGDGVTIEDCINTGVISAIDTSLRYSNIEIGGIAGGFCGSANTVNEFTIKRSINQGDIIFQQTNENNTSSSYNRMELKAGGLIGEFSGTMENCYNMGSVKASWSNAKYKQNYIGGLVGQAGSSRYINILKNSYSIADLSSTGLDSSFVGGVIGLKKYTVKAYALYFDSDKSPEIPAIAKDDLTYGDSAEVLNVGGLSTANMKKDQLAWQLNTTMGSSENAGVWSRINDYPIFADTSNSPIYRITFVSTSSNSNRYTNNKSVVTFPKDPEPTEGYYFNGWYNADLVRVTESTVFSGDSKVEAQFGNEPDLSYTITFVDFDGTEISSRSVDYGKIPTAPAVTRSSTEEYIYTLVGWSPALAIATENATYTTVYDSAEVTSAHKSIATAQVTKFHINIFGRSIQVEGMPTNAKVAVFDMQGSIVQVDRTYEARRLTINMQQIGTFILKINNQVQIISVK